MMYSNYPKNISTKIFPHFLFQIHQYSVRRTKFKPQTPNSNLQTNKGILTTLRGLCHEISKGQIWHQSKDPKKLEHNQCQERVRIHLRRKINENRASTCCRMHLNSTIRLLHTAANCSGIWKAICKYFGRKSIYCTVGPLKLWKVHLPNAAANCNCKAAGFQMQPANLQRKLESLLQNLQPANLQRWSANLTEAWFLRIFRRKCVCWVGFVCWALTFGRTCSLLDIFHFLAAHVFQLRNLGLNSKQSKEYKHNYNKNG